MDQDIRANESMNEGMLEDSLIISEASSAQEFSSLASQEHDHETDNFETANAETIYPESSFTSNVTNSNFSMPSFEPFISRQRSDTIASDDSSVDFSGYSTESETPSHDEIRSSNEFDNEVVDESPASDNSSHRSLRTTLSSDEETDPEGSDPHPHVLQRSTTLERILSDAIVHQAPVEELKTIIEAGSQVMDPNPKRPNPLHYTVWQNYPGAAELLIEQGYDVNALDDYGYSALHLAARRGYTDIMQILINHGSTINFNSKTDDPFPTDAVEEPLRLAIKFGHFGAAKLLLENGANPSGRYFFGAEINLVSPLRPDLLELLLMYGANINEQDRNGMTCIMKACRLRQGLESLLILLTYGGDVNIRADSRHDNRTALHYAVLSGSIEIVSVLLESGAQVNFEEDYNKPTPLHLAVRRGDLKVISLLIDKGADVNSSTSLIGSVLHMACSEKVHNRLEVLELLLSRGADPNIIVPGLDGTPMLPPLGDYLIASEEHDASVINLLLRYGAKVVLKSPQTSPLGLLSCVSSLREEPLVLVELLEGAQQFDLEMIRHTSLLGTRERQLCLLTADSPLPLRHISRVCFRHKSGAVSPDAILNLRLPSLISKYLLYEIS